MGWRENMQPASFRGVPFAVDGTAYGKGRRVSVRKLAGRDGSVQQDHDREPDEIDVVAFVYGDEYDALRDELEEALCEPGPGPLVLPTRGERWVRVTRGPATSEQRDAMGVCTIRFSCVVEDRFAGSLRARASTAAGVELAASSARLAAVEEFEDAYETGDLPAWRLTSTVRALGRVTDALRVVQRQAQTVTAVGDRASGALGELNASLATVLSVPSDLVTQLVDAINSTFAIADTAVVGVDRMTGLPLVLAGPFDRAGAARTTLRMASTMAALTAPDVAGTSASAAQERANTAAVVRTARALALARAAGTFAAAPFDSATLALEALAAVSDEVDALSLEAGDRLFGALADLRAALAAHLTETAAQLPRVVVHTVADPLSSLVVAHELYGDARRELDVLARNRPREPLFLQGALEVLEP